MPLSPTNLLVTFNNPCWSLVVISTTASLAFNNVDPESLSFNLSAAFARDSAVVCLKCCNIPVPY